MTPVCGRDEVLGRVLLAVRGWSAGLLALNYAWKKEKACLFLISSPSPPGLYVFLSRMDKKWKYWILDLFSQK